MRAVRVETNGGPEVLRLADVPEPRPGPGQVRIKVAAAGVNFVDIYNRKGLYNVPRPFTVGAEAAGTVDALGDGVTDFTVGQHVASMSLPGAYAEFVVVDASQVVPVPEGVGLRTAAAVMLQGVTAHYLSHSTFALMPGQTALIHAAAGGVGALLVQMAKMLGARVIGTVSTEEKAAIARESGADKVIRYTEQDFEAETRQFTNGAGVDVVYDSVGRATFDQSLNCLRPRGYLVLFGQSSGPVPPVDPQLLNRKGSLYLTRPTTRDYIATREELLWRAHDVFTWIQDSRLRVRIDQTFPLDQAAAAQQYLEDRKTRGKVLLVP